MKNKKVDKMAYVRSFRKGSGGGVSSLSKTALENLIKKIVVMLHENRLLFVKMTNQLNELYFIQDEMKKRREDTTEINISIHQLESDYRIQERYVEALERESDKCEKIESEREN